MQYWKIECTETIKADCTYIVEADDIKQARKALRDLNRENIIERTECFENENRINKIISVTKFEIEGGNDAKDKLERSNTNSRSNN